MRNTILISTLCVILTMGFLGAGCARVTSSTTYPLYDPKTDPKFDERYVGTWLPQIFCIELRKGEDNAYLANSGLFGTVPPGYTGDDTKIPSAHLVKIGKYDYFFAAPLPGETGTSLTGCCRVDFANSKIILRSLNLTTITNDLEKHPDALKHEWRAEPITVPSLSQTQPTTVAVKEPSTQPTTEPCGPRNGHLQITDEPAAVRAYLIKHQDDPDMFSSPMVFFKIAP